MAKTKKSLNQRKAGRSKQQKESAAVIKEATASISTTVAQSKMELPSTPNITSTPTSTTPIPTLPTPPIQTNLPTVSPVSSTTVPAVAASAKPVTTRTSRTSVVPRTFTLAPGQTVQNLQVATSSGLQTIQVSET